MDELDRLFRRMVQNIRSGYPEYLTQPFEVAETYQHLVPYRHNRRELEIETNQDYEFALCQMLSGERGYLVGDAAMQEKIRREIASSNPNTGVFREFAASRVSLAPDAGQVAERLSAEPASIRAAAPPVVGGPVAKPTRPRPSSPVVPDARSPSSPTLPLPAVSAAAPAPPSAAAARGAPSTSTGPVAAPRAASTERVAPAHAVSGDPSTRCHYCDGSLPQDRRATFCPHCGQNLTVQRCPACGAELEVNWKFCITCGRSVAPADAE
ncbi:MAG: zinc ribbon domain-containing protein [Gemmatimonadota bacterium]|nr:zinc ribbon domain-containing protein [Gemmatimonadota bacterium]